MSTDNKDKIIEVIDNSGSFQANEPVVVCGQTSMGLQAVLLAFVFPLFMIVTGIASGTVLGWDESLSAFTGLAILAPYYGILYILRKKLEKRFIFTLEKQKTNSSIA
jgi:sigma-E factor negative regulatory protein RseC